MLYFFERWRPWCALEIVAAFAAQLSMVLAVVDGCRALEDDISSMVEDQLGTCS